MAGARAPTTRRPRRRWPFILATGLLTTLALAVGASAATPPDLGTARSFRVLAGAGITNTGATTVSGDIGSFGSSSAITGFPPASWSPRRSTTAATPSAREPTRI
jgi:Ice-binding-like